MSSCTTPQPNAPVVSITLVGTGEPLLRMEKRLSCAAAGLGIRLNIEVRKDADVMAIPFSQTPAVLYKGKVIFTGLPRTEEIEIELKKLI